MGVLSLIRSKNRCVQRFLDLTEEFCFLAEGDRLERLEEFTAQRDAAIRAMELFDRKINEAVAGLTAQEKTPELVSAILGLIEQRDRMIERIQELDRQLIGRIEAHQASLMKELADARKSKQTLNKFKSTWVPESGEGLDHKI